MVALAADATTSTAAATTSTRRLGWTLIASLVTFIILLAFIAIGGADADQEARSAADAEGSTIHTLSPEAEARIAGRHATYWVVAGVLVTVPFVVFARGMHEVRRHGRTPGSAALAAVASWAGLASLVVWVMLGVLIIGLLAGPNDLPPLVRNLDSLKVPLTTGTSLLGLTAVLCAGLTFRRDAIAPRLAGAAVLVAAMLIVAAVATTIATSGEMAFAPITPMLPALLLGIGLVRAAPRGTA